MKQIKFLALALTFLMGLTFTSCLDSDSGPYQWGDIVTVDQSWGFVTLKSDGGYTYNPTNPDFLKYTNSSDYVERAQVVLQFVEGEEFQEGKNEYKVTIINAAEIPVKDFTAQPDTITDKKILQLDEKITGVGKYINVAFSFNYTSNMQQVFDMYPVQAEGDLLTVKLCHSYGKLDNSYSQGSLIYSFNLPYFVDLERLLEQNEAGKLVPVNDSISVMIVADGSGGSELKSQKIKMRARGL